MSDLYGDLRGGAAIGGAHMQDAMNSNAPKSEPPLALALDKLASRIEQHKAAIALLLGRLQPVSKVEPPPEPKEILGELRKDAGSPVVLKIHSFADEIDFSTRKLNTLMLRLEV